MKREIVESLEVIQIAQANPLRQWEDEEFAKEVLGAERVLEANQLFRPDGSLMLNLGTVSSVLKREELKLTLNEAFVNADQGRIKAKLERVTDELRVKAEQEDLTADVRLLLDIT